MTQQPRIIQAIDIQFLDDAMTRAVCLSMSDSSLVYEIDLIAKTCKCKGFQYCRKLPKTCRHLVSTERLKAIIQSQKK